MDEQKPPDQPTVRDTLWVLGAGSQAGCMLVIPVLAALVGGYFLDRRLGTLPWITLFLTLVGTIVGPIIIYRWVTTTVQRHLDKTTDEGGYGTENENPV